MGFEAVLLTHRVDPLFAYRNGSSYSAASPSGIVHPKSRIHFPAGRRVRSIPFAHGFSTSAFGRPFGFAGRRSHSRAWSPETSKGPPFVFPP